MTISDTVRTPSRDLPRVAVGMSGGLDSSMTAWLLKQQEYHVIGITMQVWDGSWDIPDVGAAGCFGPGEARDLAAARSIAQRLGIEHHTVPLADEYRKHVIDYFRSQYLAGRTPNPCVMCNRHLKFGLLIERAAALGLPFDRFATGHYARLVSEPGTGTLRLARGRDRNKDQSYFLAFLESSQLERLFFPLGEMTKPEVRETARKAGFSDLADKEESQDFVEGQCHEKLFTPEELTPGPILDMEDRVIGRHQGLIHYTIGQRKGLGIGGSGRPLYVVEVNAEKNAIRVGPQDNVFQRILTASGLHWHGERPTQSRSLRFDVQIRLKHEAAPAEVTVDVANNLARIEFEEPQLSMTPGQAAVFYRKDCIYGAGIIERVSA